MAYVGTSNPRPSWLRLPPHPLGGPLPSMAAVATAAGVPAAALATLPTMAWAPSTLPSFNPADYDPKKFAEAQFNRWVAPEMQAAIDKGRAQLSTALKVSLPKLPALGKSEVADWTAGYIASHGPPKNLDDGAKMVTAFAHTQAEKLGVPPEYIAAADALMHPPKSVEEGAAMVVNLGKGYLERFGVPLLQNELMSVSSNLAMVTQAIPVQFAVAGFDALKDGKLSKEEIAGIAVQACAYACGLLLQAIGIPAPLGALLSGIIAQGLMSVADNVIHADDADTRARKAAYAALDAQRQALMKECASAAQKTWNATQDYWDKTIAPIQSLLDMPEISRRIQAAGGIRYYGRNTVTLPPGVTLPYTSPETAKLFREADDYEALAQQADAAAQAADASAAKAPAVAGGRGASYQTTKAYFQVTATAARKKAAELRVKGTLAARKPLYQYGFDCLWWEGPLDSTYDPQKADFRTMLPANARPFPDGCMYFSRIQPTWDNSSPSKTPGGLPLQSLDPAKWEQKPYWPPPSDKWERCHSRKVSYPSFRAQDSEADCVLADKWAGENRYAFKIVDSTHDLYVRLTPYSDHSSPVQLKKVTIGPGAMVDGKPSAQAALMFWGAYRQPVVDWQYSQSSDKVAWQKFGEIVDSQLEIYKVAGKWTTKIDLPMDYCDVNQWVVQVQIAAAAAALVQQDIIRTVAWQVGAEHAAKVAAEIKATQEAAAAAAAAKAAATKQAANLVVARQNAAAALITQRATMAIVQAKAIGQARIASGAFARALKSRVEFQAAQATHRAAIVIGGLAAGALLLWAVMRKTSR